MVEFSRQAQWSVAVFVQGVGIIHLVKDDLADVGVSSGRGAVQRGTAGSVLWPTLVLNPDEGFEFIVKVVLLETYSEI